MKVLDLFSGIGGFSLGLERAGMETVAFCEIDKHCHAVLRKHWPKIPIVDDVSKLDGYTLQQTLGRINVICGGFPCTDISIAGKKKGLVDENGNRTRSGLWFEYKRIIGELKPDYVIIENVANLRSNGLVTVLQDLWALGYDAEWHIISARAVGACHLRERCWIIAYAANIGRHGRSNVERESGDNQYWKDSTKGNCKTRISTKNLQSTYPNGERLEGRLKIANKLQNKKNKGNKTGRDDLNNEALKSPNADNLRLWKSFDTEKEKSEWWAKATASFRDWWETESEFCRVDDGLSKELDSPERIRKERIKQLGNSIVPQIAELIGKSIMEASK